MRSIDKYNSAALSLTLALALGSACSKNDKDPLEQCLSPAAVSGLYPGDRSEGVTADEKTWRLGVIITNLSTILEPERYTGTVIRYGPTAGNTSGLEKLPTNAYPFDDRRLSRPIPSPYTEFIVRIGRDDVVFTARNQAESGSPDCNEPPPMRWGVAEPLDSILAPGSPGPVPPDWP